MAGASKPKVMVRFHLEANPASGEAFTTSERTPGGRAVTLARVAEISERDVVAIYPFHMEEYNSWGCYFFLDAHGKLALSTFSAASRGALLLAYVNARPITAMVIDRQINDGIITISNGLTEQEVALLKTAFPVPGEPFKKKRRR